MKSCPACNQSLADDAAVCPFCGERLSGGKTLFGMPPLQTKAPPATPGVPRPAAAALPFPLAAPGASPFSAPPVTSAPVKPPAPDDDDDDDDDDDSSGATMMIPALRPEAVAELLGERVPAPSSGKEGGDPATLATEALFPALQPTALAAAATSPPTVPARPAAPLGGKPAPAVSDDDDDDDDEQDQPTMAIPAIDWSETLEAPAALVPSLGAGAATAAPTVASLPFHLDSSSGAKGHQPPVTFPPQTVPAPGAVPPPVAGIEEQKLVAGLPFAAGGAAAVPTSAPPPVAPPPEAPFVPPPSGPARRKPSSAPAPFPSLDAPLGEMEAAPAAPPRPRPIPAPVKEPVVAPPKKGGAGKVILLVLLVLFVLGGLGAGGAYYWFFLRTVKVAFETDVVHQEDDGKFQVTLKVRQTAGAPRQLSLRFQEESREFSGEGSFTFTVEDGKLQVGSNVIAAQILGDDPKSPPIATIPVDLFLNYRFAVPDTRIQVGQKEQTFTITVPEGGVLEVDEAQVEGDGNEKTVKLDLEKLVGPFDKQAKAEFTVPVKLGLTLPEKPKITDTLELELLLPAADLRVDLPAKLVTARERIDVNGLIHVEANVTVDGKEPDMYEDGTFEGKAALKPGSQELVIVATHEGRVPFTQRIQVERLSKADLKTRRTGIAEEAEIWAQDATSAPGQEELLAGVEGELKGKKLKLEGQVLQVTTSQGKTHVVVALAADPGNRRPVQVDTVGVVDVLPGERALVYGRLVGKGKYKASEEAPETELPVLEAEYLLGG